MSATETREQKCVIGIHSREVEQMKGQKIPSDNEVHPPGVEPGARPWEDPMLPLHHECLLLWAQFSYHYGNSISEMYTTVALGLLYHPD